MIEKIKLLESTIKKDKKVKTLRRGKDQKTYS
mgnify:CR=1 FL=1